MTATLIVLEGSHKGRRIPVRVPEFLIGRDPECHLRPASKDVHWQHCAIVTRDDGVFLRDDGGPTGTFLNRRLLVGGEMQLQEGDLIGIGPLNFLVDLPKEESATARAARHLNAGDTRAPGMTGPVAFDFQAMTPLSSATPLPPLKRMKDSRELLCPN